MDRGGPEVRGRATGLLQRRVLADLARQVDQTPIPYSPDREWFTLRITVKPTPVPEPHEGGPKEDESAKSAPAKRDSSKQSKAGAAAKPAASGEAGKPKPAAPAKPLPAKTFYYTLVVFPPGESTIGSVSDEPDRVKDELRHQVRLTRPIAFLDREIAPEELIAFDPNNARYMRQYDAKPEDASCGVDWYDAVGFAAGWGSRWGWRRAISPAPTRPGWLRSGIHMRQARRRAGHRATGRWSWAAGDFTCRRKRSGKRPVEPARGRRLATEAM